MSYNSVTMDIPPSLEAQIRAGNVVLVLGAGASMGAIDQDGRPAPSGDELRDILSDRYLGGRLKNRTLAQVAEYAISEKSIADVQNEIRSLFEGLQPTEAHLLLPTFRWWGLATTNYDRLIEKAYAANRSPNQKVVPLIQNGDQIDTVARAPENLILLKLHGCITRTGDPSCPLILTVDQYIDHRSGRNRLFEQLTDWGYEHTFVFIGHSLQDHDIRQVIKDMSRSEARSRFFCVVPDADPIEQRALELQRITVLQGTFHDFMKALDSSIPSPFRGVIPVRPSSDEPIAVHFRVAASVPSQNLQRFLQIEVDYVNALSATENLDPKDFYRGLNPGFSAIEKGLDVPRSIGEEIMLEVLLGPEQRMSKPELILLKAHAGAGKTVLMRRLAWDAAHDYEKLCLFLRPKGIINAPALEELADLCQKRIFLFVDDAADRHRELEFLLENLGSARENLTIIAAERINEWNVGCQSLNSYVSTPYELKYLNTAEINGLIGLLAKFRAEGDLEGRSIQEKKAAFEDRAGRQLLVALHEATFGRPFVEIIQNEFDNIWPLEAKMVYLTICVLNRLNVPVRAGVISRLHGIPFEEFKSRLFSPLEHIVQAQYDQTIRDYVYNTRHPYIAQMVFDVVLARQEERFDRYIKCLGALNIDYSSDRIAFREMTRARVVLDLFSSKEMWDTIYRVATERAGERDGTLIHQRALYELNRPDGNVTASLDLIRRALNIRPYDVSIKHSLAEIQLRMVDHSRTSLEREAHRREATTICREISKTSVDETSGLATLAKVGLGRLEEFVASEDAVGIEQAIRETEQALAEGFQRSPDDPFLSKIESRFAELIGDSSRVITSLEKAIAGNPRDTALVRRLSRIYASSGSIEKGREVLERALDVNGGDKRLHYALAVLMEDNGIASETLVAHHLQRSFTPGDSNFSAQLRYGRALFAKGDLEGAKSVFKTLKAARVAPEIKYELHYPLIGEMSGEVAKIETTYCFVVRDGPADWIYCYRENSPSWDSLGRGMRVRFRVAFSMAGPGAFDVRPENPDPTR